MKILHLIESLDHDDGARQLRHIAPALTAGAGVEICCLGRETSVCSELRRHGIPTHALGWTRWFDVGAPWRLREIVREAAPDVIHVWHLSALQMLALVAHDMLSRVVMNAPLPARGQLAWWDRILLDRIHCLAFADVHDQARWAGQNVLQPGQRVVMPGVRIAAATTPHEGSVRQIVCAGPLERETGMRQAIWALDILVILYPELQLHLVGEGTQQPTLEALCQGLHNQGSVHFHRPADTRTWLERADMVWVPSLTNVGRQIALDAMALGKPVVASNVPCLRELIRDGETGLLATAGDVVTLTRRAHILLGNADLRVNMGQAARAYVERRFAVEDAVRGWQEIYQMASRAA